MVVVVMVMVMMVVMVVMVVVVVVMVTMVLSAITTVQDVDHGIDGEMVVVVVDLLSGSIGSRERLDGRGRDQGRGRSRGRSGGGRCGGDHRGCRGRWAEDGLCSGRLTDRGRGCRHSRRGCRRYCRRRRCCRCSRCPMMVVVVVVVVVIVVMLLLLLLVVLRRLALVRLEAHLENPVTERVTVQALDGDHRLVIVGHRHETEAFALVRLQVADHFDRLDGAERTEQLPQHVLLGLWGEIIHEDTPAGTIHRVPG